MRNIVLHQYQQIIDKAVRQTAGLDVPPEGWLKTLRKALGMSGAQLGRLMGVSRAQIAQSERNELSGAVTLRTLQSMAEAMGCRVVYAIGPVANVEDLVARRAREKAKQIVERINTHMALEKQTLNEERREYELNRVEQDLLKNLPLDLWDDVK
jgi:predicted DNA-binding mobile mystery protein A